MKAAEINEFHQKLEIKDIPVPELDYKEVLVKIHSYGVCHTICTRPPITRRWPSHSIAHP